ncbi:MAG: hypothetical protein ACM3MK_00255 [Chitinophagales bacterium]
MKKFSAILFLILLLIGATPVTALAKTDNKPVVYMVVVDNLAITDLDPAKTPNLVKLSREGSVGVASNRTMGNSSAEDISLTIGGGNLALSTPDGVLGYNQDEIVTDRIQTAGQLYRNLTGYSTGKDGCVVVNLPELQNGMLEESVTTKLGAMGEILRKNGLKVCLLGNADSGNRISRPATAIAMDAKGRVQLGDVGPNTLRPCPDSFLESETNYGYLADQVSHYKGQANLVVINLADLKRLQEADMPLPGVLEKEKARILDNIDDFVGTIRNKIDPSRDLLMVISSSPSQVQLDNKNSFTPVLIWGSKYHEGYVTSPATKRDYIVASTDIAPTVLNFFGLEVDRATMIGQPIKSISAQGDVLARVQSLSESTATTNRLRTPLVKGYVGLQMFVILLGLFAIIFFRRLATVALPLVLSLAIVPLVLLPLGKLPLPFDWLYFVVAIAATAILTWIVAALSKYHYYKAFFLVCLLTLLAISIDVLTGSSLIKGSVMGYDPMVGARYYGIGNEYMGILLGCTLITAVLVFRSLPRALALVVTALLFLAESAIIAAPMLGANSDGVITAPLAFLASLVLMAGWRIRPRTVLIAAIVLLGMLSGVVYFDMHRAAELQSHIGRAANQIAAGGLQEALIIVSRKIGMNLKLMRYTIWTQVFLIILGAMTVLIFRPAGVMSNLRDRHPVLFKGFIGIIIAAIVGLIINDSGIVAAATTSIYLVVPVMMLILAHVASEYRQEKTRVLDKE